MLVILVNANNVSNCGNIAGIRLQLYIDERLKANNGYFISIMPY